MALLLIWGDVSMVVTLINIVHDGAGDVMIADDGQTVITGDC